MAMSRWLLGRPDIALVFLQFARVSETISFYSISRYHWSLYLSSHVQSLISLLWNFDQIASILMGMRWLGMRMCLAVCTGASVLVCTGGMSTLLVVASQGICHAISMYMF